MNIMNIPQRGKENVYRYTLSASYNKNNISKFHHLYYTNNSNVCYENCKFIVPGFGQNEFTGDFKKIIGDTYLVSVVQDSGLKM